jgi:hypothetical protein
MGGFVVFTVIAVKLEPIWLRLRQATRQGRRQVAAHGRTPAEVEKIGNRIGGRPTIPKQREERDIE